MIPLRPTIRDLEQWGRDQPKSPKEILAVLEKMPTRTTLETIAKIIAKLEHLQYVMGMYDERCKRDRATPFYDTSVRPVIYSIEADFLDLDMDTVKAHWPYPPLDGPMWPEVPKRIKHCIISHCVPDIIQGFRLVQRRLEKAPAPNSGASAEAEQPAPPASPAQPETTKENREQKRQASETAGNSEPPPQYVFKNEGATWRIIYGEHETTVDDTKGVRYIHHLTKNPNTPIECLDIERACSDAIVREVKTVDSEEAQDVDLHPDTFNLKQLEDYDVTTIQRAKDKLEAEWASAGDPSRKAELQEQIHALDEYLGKNLDIHGGTRPVGPQEDARKRVSAAINTAKRSITAKSDIIGKHFKSFITARGTAFIYEPDRELSWVLS